MKDIILCALFKGDVGILDKLGQLLDDIGLSVKFWIDFRDNQTGRFTDRVEIFTKKLGYAKADIS